MTQNTSINARTSISFAQRRRDFLLILAIIALTLSFGGALAQFLISLTQPIRIIGLVGVGALAGLSLVTFIWGQSGRVDEATYLLLGTLAAIFIAPLSTQFIQVLLGALLLTSAAVLARTWVFRAIVLIILLKYGYQLWRIALDLGITPTPEGNRLVVEIATLILVGVTMRFFIYTLERASNESTRNAELLGATAEIGQTTSRLMDLEELFGQTVELIREKLDYYHVQIFMLMTEGDAQYASLVASTGRAGRELLNRGYRVAVGTESVIGRVTLLGEPMTIFDTDLHKSDTRAELMASTRSELAVPIFDGEQIIGALDVQSVSRHAFGAADLRALQVMANQIGNAVRNAQLFQAQQVNVEENRRLLAESEASLEEIQRLNSRLTREAWGVYLAQQPRVPGVTMRRGEILSDTAWTPAMIEAWQTHQPVAADDGYNTVAVPILLRGEVIGVIEIDAGRRNKQADAVDLGRNVAEQLAISLENARLIDEAQDTAQREQRISEITAQYQSAETIDELLRITLDELGRSLGASRSMVRLGRVTSSPNGNGGNGHHANGGDAS